MRGSRACGKLPLIEVTWKVLCYWPDVGRYKTQVTGHRKCNKKLDTLLGFLCLFICFISGYVTIRHMFSIDHASGCSKSKRKMFSLHPEELGLRMEQKNKNQDGRRREFRGKKTTLADKLFWNQFHWRDEKLSSELATHICFVSYGLYWVAHFGLGLHTLMCL